MELCSFENQIEALIFASEKGITIEDIDSVLTALANTPHSMEDIRQSLDVINRKYQQSNLTIELVLINNRYQFLTKKSFYPAIKLLELHRSSKALSQSALETLSIIAYKQPVTKSEVEEIRGVNCDYSIQRLLDRELVIISGRSSGVGKPILYSVSDLFMDYFGINSMADLPKFKDLIAQRNEIGTP